MVFFCSWLHENIFYTSWMNLEHNQASKYVFSMRWITSCLFKLWHWLQNGVFLFLTSLEYLLPFLNESRAQTSIKIWFFFVMNNLMSFQTLVLTAEWCFSVLLSLCHFDNNMIILSWLGIHPWVGFKIVFGYTLKNTRLLALQRNI